VATIEPVATLVDTNVLLDVFTGDPQWGSWSGEALERTGRAGALVINPIVYAELAPRFPDIHKLDVALPSEVFLREQIPWPAAYLAGRAFREYRRRGGMRRSPLPDFFIGAHAALAGLRLLTRDPRRYRTYFPKVDLIAPA
jgi:predicted nucleic acid-binding protein